ncbi:hypothetical protein LNTAR_15327 [Lentisphaera araneosa HTCC2155]|uniref:Uncharacterized protein n=1 Tax=Lentisphaera araneosa HTCC2155 TaxID=313628 RepID=A6DRJ0_9BACT|nr:hypothetical protein [Lentisphaera araneosa]EDM25800.1 hypothetical protein LNTAR_15327 [Lentisphaera araneosa HTCC2155]
MYSLILSAAEVVNIIKPEVNYELLFYCSLALSLVLYCIGLIVGIRAARDSSHG